MNFLNTLVSFSSRSITLTAKYSKSMAIGDKTLEIGMVKVLASMAIRWVIKRAELMIRGMQVMAISIEIGLIRLRLFLYTSDIAIAYDAIVINGEMAGVIIQFHRVLIILFDNKMGLLIINRIPHNELTQIQTTVSTRAVPVYLSLFL